MDTYLISGVNGMKPKLLLNAGTCFSATSPLWYTLGLNNHYAHTGHAKEHNYLYHLMIDAKRSINTPSQLNTSVRINQKWEQNDLIKELPKKKQKKRDGKDGFMHVYPEMTKRSSYIEGKWTLEERKDFFDNPELSIDKYIKYYLKHWENFKCEYKSVADFSNNNACLSVEFMEKIKPKLLEYFDIKVTMIFRDPVRRLFSACNRVHHFERDKIIENFRKWVSSNQMEKNVYYSDIYDNHCQVWGKDNVFPIVMEEFSTDKLSDFLGYRLVTAHQNCYYPDMGSKAPKYPGLSDQYNSDKVDLDKETYEFALEHMNNVYKSFNTTFGYIPKRWQR